MSDSRNIVDPLRGAYDHLLAELASILNGCALAAAAGLLDDVADGLAKSGQIRETLVHLQKTSDLLAPASEAPSFDTAQVAHPPTPETAAADPPSEQAAPKLIPDLVDAETSQTIDKSSAPEQSVEVAILPPKKRPQARQQDIADFCAEVRKIEASGYNLNQNRASVKAWVCRGQALLANSSGSRDQSQTLRDEIQRVQTEWNERGPGDEFFGFGLQRGHAAEVWQSIAEAYDLLQLADECVEWLGTLDAESRESHADLISQAAAAESLLRRRLANSPAGIFDAQQSDLHGCLLAIKGDHFIRWWIADSPESPTDAELHHEAKGLKTTYVARRTQHEKKIIRTQATEQLAKVLDGSYSDTFVQELADAVEVCLQAGLKHNDKKLRDWIRPYRYQLADLKRPALARLIEQLSTDATLEQKQGTAREDTDREPDPDFEQRVAELKAITKGKTLLLLGGNKGQADRQNKLRDLLELDEVEWPDVESHSKVRSFEAPVRRADIVCLLIRWSRHSYKEALDDAKGQNKLTAILARGIGLNTVVFDLHEQLCRDSAINRKLEATA